MPPAANPSRLNFTLISPPPPAARPPPFRRRLRPSVTLAAPDLALPSALHGPYRPAAADPFALGLRLLHHRPRDASWSGYRGPNRPDDEDLMSQRHGTASGPSSSFAHDADAHSPRFHAFEAPHSRGPALPPIHPPPDDAAPPHPDGRTPRPLGVASILNPPPDGAEPKGHRRTASQMESPSPIEHLSGPPSAFFGQPAPGFGPGQEEPRRPQSLVSAAGSQRRILSPRSPLYRPRSMGMIRPPTGTINAQETPFLSPSSQDYSRAEPASTSIPPLPTPPAAPRSGYNFPPPPPSIPTPPIHQSHSRRTSGGVSLPPQPRSASASPGGPYSYGPGGQNSPATPYGDIGRPSPVPFPPAPSSATAQQFSSQEPERSYGIPVASTGQSNYQLLTLETNQGHVQIPVDVQAASKMADEKRKRNAGASARFRARRKEKEKEASTTIARLEQQVRGAIEDMEFYKRERDYFAQLVYQSPGGDRHFPRPPSPRSRRLSMQAPGSAGTSSGHGSTSAGSTPGAGYPSYPSEPRGDQRAAESERNVRRRTSTYLPPPHATPGAQNHPQMAYQSTSYPPLAAAAHAPRSRTPSGSMQQSHQQPQPQTGYPTPYAPDRADRSWPPQPLAGRHPPPPPPGQQ